MLNRLKLKRFIQKEIDFCSIFTILGCLVVLAPVAVIFSGMKQGGVEWPHIQSTVLPMYLSNTLILVLCVSVLSLLFAVPTAWFVSLFEFRGRRFWQWALILPLAIPSYVAAFTYFDGLEWAIPLIVKVRQIWGIEESQMIERIIRYGLLIFVLSSVLYPYLFLSLRSSFSRQQNVFFEAARMLGKKPSSIFWEIGLPLARPTLVAGLSLIIMEVVNDYGAVHFFGVPTLTEGIFRTWFGLGDRVSGLRLAGLVMLLIFLFLSVEQWQRRRLRFTEAALSAKSYSRIVLSRKMTITVNLLCLIPLGMGFAFPLGRLIHWAYLSFDTFKFNLFFKQAASSLLLAVGTSFILCIVAFFFAFCTKTHQHRWLHRLIRFATLGYAIPGAVIAIGVMILLGKVDQLHNLSWMFSGSLFAISFAYLVRFLTVTFQPIKAGMLHVCGSLHDASLMLGQPLWRTLTHIHFPLLKSTLLASSILVFIDITKELPLTLILRPAKFETLATFAFGYAKEGNIYDCALPCLLIITLGTLGLLVINNWIEKTQAK